MNTLSFATRAVALSLFSAVTVACGQAKEAGGDTAPPPAGQVRFAPGAPQLASIAVDTVRARRERTVAVLPAQLLFDEDHTVRVVSPVAGRIRSIEAYPGQHVARGGALAHIASSDMAQARSDLAKADAVAAQAGAALERARDLLAHRVIAQKDLEQAQSDDRQARAEQARARQRVELLGSADAASDGEFVLRSPIAGDVVDRTANPGQEVRPDNATPLFTVSDLGTLWLVVNAYQRDLAAVRAGERIVFTTDALPGREFAATVSLVANALDPQTHTAMVRALLPNPGRVLRAQTAGTARLFVRDPGGAPSVPTTALLTRGDETIVFVELAPGRFVRRTVVVREDDGQTATIASGLRIGDRVVTRGSILLAAEADRGR